MIQNSFEFNKPSVKKDDIAGRDYWNDAWADRRLAAPINPRDMSLKNYVNQRFHLIFERILSTRRMELKLLEIGCAGSTWLPYFALEYGFDVTGIDYSEVGCQQAREVLARAGVEGKVHHVDMFDIPNFMRNAFDIVITFGVIEHFVDTTSCMRTLTRYCKPEGIIISIIPNLKGLTGFLQKIMNKDILSVHKVLTAEDLIHFSTEAGLTTIFSEYFPFFNPAVMNLGFIQPRTCNEFLKVYFRKVLTAIAMIVWSAEKATCPIGGNRYTSSSIINISILKS